MLKLQLFYGFLVTHNCLSGYISARHAGMVETGRKDFVQWLAETHPHSFLGNAFVWSDTPEGHEYWSEMNMRWRKFYDERKVIFDHKKYWCIKINRYE